MTPAFVLAHDGDCSFCGKRPREARAFVRRTDRPAIICDECIELCFEIRSKLTVETQLTQEERLQAIIKSMREKFEQLPGPPPVDVEEFERELRAKLANPSKRTPIVLACSFCGAAKADVERLISGPRIFICNVCVDAAAAAVPPAAPTA